MNRGARYRCAMVFVSRPDDPTPVVCEASWEGRIATAACGTGGFGYDPLFLVGETERTAAEYEAGEKNRVSHRGKALRALVAALGGASGQDGGGAGGEP